MEPINKSSTIADLLEKMVGRTTAIQGNRCVRQPIGCGELITGFRDELSAHEYRISGLCQKCQDELFGGV